MDIEERIRLVREVATEGEIVTEDELRALFEAKPNPICYDGFEPSGRIHIAQGVLRAINVNKMTKAGCTFKMFVADWHAWANNKMGGDLEKIQTVGKYFVEVWRAAGMDLKNVEFVWASQFVTDEEYWKKVMNVARDSSLDRILRTTQIMGRSDKDKLSASQILYPCMQAADIFHLKADITQLGMDQRKVNMLAREVGPKLGFWKPVVVSHHMLMGLQAPPTGIPSRREQFEDDAIRDVRATLSGLPPEYEGTGLRVNDAIECLAGVTNADHAAAKLRSIVTSLARDVEEQYGGLTPEARADKAAQVELYLAFLRKAVDRLERVPHDWDVLFIQRQTSMKMSKSNPDSAIFMTDSKEDVDRKMKKAFCPEKQVTENPILEYYRYIIFEKFPSVTIERPEKFGGNLTFNSYQELETAFAEGKLHPMDAKKGCGHYVNLLLEPVRKHFETDPEAKRLKELVDSWQVTR